VAALALHARAAAPADTWMAVDTPNFEVLGNVGEGELKRVALKFEQFRYVLGQVLAAGAPALPARPRVFAFKGSRSYRPYLPVVDGKPAEFGGYFQPGRRRAYITLKVEHDSDDPYQVVFHEYVHLMMQDAHALPSMVHEGMAEYYSNCDLEGRAVKLGRPDPNALRVLRDSRLLPLETLLVTRVPTHGADAQRLFYAESWLLTHYLLTERERGREQFKIFLARLVSGQEPVAAFRSSFLVEPAAMEQELRRYMGRPAFRYYRIPLPPASVEGRGLHVRALGPLEAEALLADLLAQLPGGEADARSRLQRVLEQDPAQSAAREALADLQAAPAAVTTPPSGPAAPVAAQPDSTALKDRLRLARELYTAQDVDGARKVLEAGAAQETDPGFQLMYQRELKLLAGLHGMEGWLVEVRCRPGGALEFVIESDRGRTSLRASSPTSFSVRTGGLGTQVDLQCGHQRRRARLVYREPESAGMGMLSSLSLIEP
jgi:hypothetical protein